MCEAVGGEGGNVFVDCWGYNNSVNCSINLFLTGATKKISSSRDASHVSYALDEDEESGDEDYRDSEGVYH